MLDSPLADLWHFSDGKTLEEILRDFQSNKFSSLEILAGLACLAEAGLLSREIKSSEKDHHTFSSDGTVSVVLVAFNSRAWLEICIPSLLSQTLPVLEIILVDNASCDATVSWVKETYPGIDLLQLEKSQSLAQALNIGAASAKGDYLLIINPDVTFEPTAIANLVFTAQDQPDCAAVAAKLKLSFTPGLLNGMGNYVGPASWGTDYGLGQLDLGQFDQINEVPSACFAAALIPIEAYKIIGPFDPGFPLYYEDSEWCYRARIYGYKILAAPGAVGNHAFGQESNQYLPGVLTSEKLEQVIYGRLRFIFKLLSPVYLFYFFVVYTIEAFFRLLEAALHGRWYYYGAYFNASLKMIKSLKEILDNRRMVQTRRVTPDRDLFQIHKNIPLPLVRYEMPELSLDIVRHIYLPAILSDNTRPLPEFELSTGYTDGQKIYPGKMSIINRLLSTIRTEGFSGFLLYFGKWVVWRLNRM